jgi:hypothetical protein
MELLVDLESGGRVFPAAPGHQKEHYADPLSPRRIPGGIQWVMGEVK